MKGRTHSNIPVASGLSATFTLTNVQDIGVIAVDTDGNGTSDLTLAPESPYEVAQELKRYVANLNVPILPKLLLIEVGHIEDNLSKGKTKQALKAVRSMQVSVGIGERFRILTPEQRSVINAYLARIAGLLIN